MFSFLQISFWFRGVCFTQHRSLVGPVTPYVSVFSFCVHLAWTRQVAEPQLPTHFIILRALLLAWMCPLLRLAHAAADGWLASGMAGWLTLRWAEETLGDDHSRLILQHLHDTVSLVLRDMLWNVI